MSTVHITKISHDLIANICTFFNTDEVNRFIQTCKSLSIAINKPILLRSIYNNKFQPTTTDLTKQHVSDKYQTYKKLKKNFMKTTTLVPQEDCPSLMSGSIIKADDSKFAYFGHKKHFDNNTLYIQTWDGSIEYNIKTDWSGICNFDFNDSCIYLNFNYATLVYNWNFKEMSCKQHTDQDMTVSAHVYNNIFYRKTKESIHITNNTDKIQIHAPPFCFYCFNGVCKDFTVVDHTVYDAHDNNLYVYDTRFLKSKNNITETVLVTEFPSPITDLINIKNNLVVAQEKQISICDNKNLKELSQIDSVQNYKLANNSCDDYLWYLNRKTPDKSTLNCYCINGEKTHQLLKQDFNCNITDIFCYRDQILTLNSSYTHNYSYTEYHYSIDSLTFV